MDVYFTLNGKQAHAALSAPTETLLQWLRAHGFTGTKEGCAEGECGACAVAVLRQDQAGRPYYESVNSCILPLAVVAGENVISVEGVAPPGEALHPVQSALIAHGGSQCGYCTPGFVISMFAEYYRPERDAFDLEAIAGNLCRCTGYRPIVDAAKSLPLPGRDDPQLPTAALLRRPTRRAPSARASEGPWHRPRTLDALFALRAEHPGAPLIAGGTDLMIGVTQHGVRHDALISLEDIPALSTFERTDRELTIGAGLTLSRLTAQLARHPGTAPLLDQLLPLFSSRLIRNRATLGGNLQTASPIGDAAPCLLALDASLSLASPRGTRRLALDAFFLGYRQTALAPDEIIACIHLPQPAPVESRFYKVSKRVLDDISIVAGAFALTRDAAGRIARLGIAYGGIAATPVRAREAEQRARGRALDARTLTEILDALAGWATPIDDHRGSAAYRRALVPRLFEKFWHALDASPQPAEVSP